MGSLPLGIRSARQLFYRQFHRGTVRGGVCGGDGASQQSSGYHFSHCSGNSADSRKKLVQYYVRYHIGRQRLCLGKREYSHCDLTCHLLWLRLRRSREQISLQVKGIQKGTIGDYDQIYFQTDNNICGSVLVPKGSYLDKMRHILYINDTMLQIGSPITVYVRMENTEKAGILFELLDSNYKLLKK